MNDKVFYSYDQIKRNIHRTLKANLLTYLPEEILDNLTDKYFRDKEGNLLCAYTGEVLDNKSNLLELEHVIPVSNGGGTILFNVVPSLKEINGPSEKWDNNLLDWWKNSKYFDLSRLENIVNYMLEGYEYCAKQDGVFTFELKESEEQDDVIKNDEYFDEMQKDIEEKEVIKKHDINTYKTFLNSLIIELENNKIDVSSYLERIKKLEKESVFEELDEQVIYQKVMLSLMRKYANNSKYKISSEVDYKKIIHNLGLDNIKDNFEVKLEDFVMTLNEENKVPINVHKSNEKLVNKMNKNTNTFIDKSNKLLAEIKNNKKVKDEDILKYELEKQIIKVFKKISNKISFNLMMEYIIEYPEILYNDNFDFDMLIKEHYKKYNNYADIIVGFCNEYEKFPSNTGTKEYEGISEGKIYTSYLRHKDNFLEEKREEIEKLKDLYQAKLGEQNKLSQEEIDNYADIIIGFCNEHEKFPSVYGTKEYEGISEGKIYTSYQRHKDNFSEEKRDEIERLKKLYPNKGGRQTFSQEEIDDYADLIIEFCNEYKNFPSRSGKKEYQGKSEVAIYSYYLRHKDKFSKEKRKEIEKLKNSFESEKYDKYADIIIGFCNEYQMFSRRRGTKEYEGISEQSIYGYYRRYKNKFFKEKQEEIEKLKDLYQDKSSKKKTEKEIDNYADIIIGFCNEHEKFPSSKGTKEYERISEKTICTYYHTHKDKFSKEKRKEIEKLKNSFESEKYDNYADIIIGFCNEYQQFPSVYGTKEYREISEKTLYNYYNAHKGNFSKEKIEEIERLKDLYQSKKDRKKVINVENKLDNTKGKGR